MNPDTTQESLSSVPNLRRRRAECSVTSEMGAFTEQDIIAPCNCKKDYIFNLGDFVWYISDDSSTY